MQELSNYLDNELDPGTRSALEQHLAQCTDCRLVVDTTRKTIQIFCDSEPLALPNDVRVRLHDALKKKIQKPSH